MWYSLSNYLKSLFRDTSELEKIIDLLEMDYEKLKKEIAEIDDEERRRQKEEELENIEAALRKYKELDDPSIPQHIADGLLISYLHKLVEPPRVIVREKGKEPKVDYSALEKYILRKFCVVTYSRIVYTYVDGRYQDKDIIEKEAKRVILQQAPDFDTKRLKGVMEELLSRVRWDSTFACFPFNQYAKELIPVDNGVVWTKEGRVFPHSPYWGFTYRLPVKYDPNAKCPKIDEFIRSLVPEENVPILYEIPALAVMQNEWFHKAYMLVGDGSNGKSTYLRLITKFLGEDNVSNVSLDKLCEGGFETAQIVGKLANIYPDLPAINIKWTGHLKALTGGDRVTVQKKYKDPFEYINRARLIFSANETPWITDKTRAFWRRWVIIEFPNTFEENPDFFNELATEEELSGFLNKVISAIERINAKGVTVTKKVEEGREEWMRRANPVYAFVKDVLERNSNHAIPKEDMYKAYCVYCEQNNLRILKKNIFGVELQRNIPVVARQRRVEGKRIWCWVGVRFKKEALKKLRGDEKEEKIAISRFEVEEGEGTVSLGDFEPEEERDWDLDDVLMEE